MISYNSSKARYAWIALGGSIEVELIVILWGSLPLAIVDATAFGPFIFLKSPQ